jgi:predicted RNase H-like nuclease (RuvC/YqgF family)
MFNWIKTYLCQIIKPLVEEEVARQQSWPVQLVQPVLSVDTTVDREQLLLEINRKLTQVENVVGERLAQFDGVRFSAELDRDKELAQMHNEIGAMHRNLQEQEERLRRYNQALARSSNFSGMPRV